MSKILSKMYIGLHVIYSLFLSDLKETRNFSTDFRKNTHISILMKTYSVGVELLHADRLKDGHDGANCRLSPFWDTPKRRFCFSQENEKNNTFNYI
jgi:hypothetical protein